MLNVLVDAAVLSITRKRSLRFLPFGGGQPTLFLYGCESGPLRWPPKPSCVGSIPTTYANFIKRDIIMFYFCMGVVVGVFLPTTYNLLIKDTVNIAWAWFKLKK